MTPDAALERALSSIDVRPGHAWRQSLAAGGTLSLKRGEAAIVYLREGEITGRTGARSACTVDAASGEAATLDGGRTLLAGDALISLGCHAVAVSSQSGAEVTVVPLEVVPTFDTRALPPLIFVSGFAGAEPAAAGLAAHLGLPKPGTGRQGDETICRLMVTTVLLSALRTWASTQREATWPPLSDDPFLTRVVTAVADDPGHEWTLDQLAALGAMSRSVFAARFREVFGTSPASYVTEVRMRRATELLDAGTSVSETSRLLGYGSDEGFRRAFRRHTGVAPSAWRTAGRPLTV
ncbi:helix-turn-helix transcriptional regulator [Microbacterium testaceum]|uniref:helix-turn-helix transcriptional regulator n=1 Tax=Microbacterium testaceum TaxID=2033 RepID=UPI0012ACD5F4|nr:AraC family transcriptional regulator [Microbacterium testaceum]